MGLRRGKIHVPCFTTQSGAPSSTVACCGVAKAAAGPGPTSSPWDPHFDLSWHAAGEVKLQRRVFSEDFFQALLSFQAFLVCVAHTYVSLSAHNPSNTHVGGTQEALVGRTLELMLEVWSQQDVCEARNGLQARSGARRLGRPHAGPRGCGAGARPWGWQTSHAGSTRSAFMPERVSLCRIEFSN